MEIRIEGLENPISIKYSNPERPVLRLVKSCESFAPLTVDSLFDSYTIEYLGTKLPGLYMISEFGDLYDRKSKDLVTKELILRLYDKCHN